MYIGIYINGELYSRSLDFENAKVEAIKYLNEKWEESNGNTFAIRDKYLCSIKALANGEPTSFMGDDISFREIEEKKYAISYTITIDECEETCNAKYLSKQIKYICKEKKVKNLFSSLKSTAEDNIRCKICINGVVKGGDVKLLTDTESEYKLYVPSMHEYHIVEVKEIV